MGADLFWYRRTLAECVSRDHARSVLMTVHHDAGGQLVATNGWCMFVVQSALTKLEGLSPGSAYHADHLAKGEVWARPAGLDGPPFPDWRRVMEKLDTPALVFEARLPAWIGAKKRRAFSIRACSIMGGSSPHLRLDEWADGALATVDLRHLRPYAAGFPVCVAVRTQEDPLVFAENAASALKPLEAKWFGVVMPLRRGSLNHGPVLKAIEAAT